MILLSFETLPILIPMLISAVILYLVMFGHLNFKHIEIKKVSIISSFISIPFVLFYFQLLKALVNDHDVNMLHIHILLMALLLIVSVLVGVLSSKRVPSILQLIGLGVFSFGCFLLLA